MILSGVIGYSVRRLPVAFALAGRAILRCYRGGPAGNSSLPKPARPDRIKLQIWNVENCDIESADVSVNREVVFSEYPIVSSQSQLPPIGSSTE